MFKDKNPNSRRQVSWAAIVLNRLNESFNRHAAGSSNALQLFPKLILKSDACVMAGDYNRVLFY